MLVRLSCWKALSNKIAAATLCVISACNVQSEVKMLPKYLDLFHHEVTILYDSVLHPADGCRR